MNLLTTNTEYCQGVLHTLYKKLTLSIKIFLLMFLVTGIFIKNSKAQSPAPTLPTCNGMTTPGFISCVNDVIVYTSNVDQVTVGTYTISPNSSGAFFTANGLTSITVPITPGANTISINVGPNPGGFTTKLTFGGVTVEDGSCSASRVVRQISATSSRTNVLCFGGTGTITAVGSGGVLPYSYTIVGPTVNTTGASSGVFTDLAPGPYTVTVRDATQNGATGCAATTSQTIVGPQAALVSTRTSVNVLCFGGATGSLNLSVTGGTAPYGYTWTAGAGGVIPAGQADDEDLTGLVAGTYSVVITDANRCTATNSVVITQPTLLVATGSGTNVSCNGGVNGTATVTATGGTSPYTYLWSNGATTATITGLAAGTYSVTVTDANACTKQASYTVTQPTLLVATGSGTNVSCNGGANGTATVTATGGTSPYTYLWSNGATTATITGLAAGTYSVTVTDANKCTTTASYIVTQPELLAAPTVAITQPTCELQTAQITVTSQTAGFLFSLNGSAYAPYPVGGYTVAAGSNNTVSQQNELGCNSPVVTVIAITPICTVCSYTQGFWGNKNGRNLLNSSGILTNDLIIGSTATGMNSIRITSSDIVKLNNSLPGGSTPGPLANIGACNISNGACFNTNYLTGGKINNVLLSQTIALSLNTRLPGSTLNNIPIQSGCLLTSAGSFPIDQSVATYLSCNSTATVSGLLALANAVLGGVLIPGQTSGGCLVPSYSAINNVVDAINNAFDECKNYNGYGACTTALKPNVSQQPTAIANTTIDVPSILGKTYIKVTPAPNPFYDNVMFNIESNISGKAVLEIFNLTGQKLKTVFEGNISAGKGQSIRYNIPEQNRSSFIYRLTVAEKTTTGKVLHIN